MWQASYDQEQAENKGNLGNTRKKCRGLKKKQAELKSVLYTGEIDSEEPCSSIHLKSSCQMQKKGQQWI